MVFLPVPDSNGLIPSVAMDWLNYWQFRNHWTRVFDRKCSIERGFAAFRASDGKTLKPASTRQR
jgi:hypothetical protein